MRSFVTVVAVALVLASHAGASNITQENVAKTREVIEAVIEAYGGAEKLSGLNSLIIESDTVAASPGQSRKPEPPWDRTEGKLLQAVDFENEIFVNRASGAGGGFEFNNGQIINGEESYQLDFRRGTAAPVAEPDFDTTSGPFIRVTPVLLVKQLQERGNTSHWLGETELDGRTHDVITLVMRVGPALSLYFDRETRLLTKSERDLAPFGLVEYYFKGYYEVDGIPMTKEFVLNLNGEPNLEWTYTSMKTNASLAKLAEVPAKLDRVAAITPDDLNLNEIDEGVFLVGGTGTYAMFVDMGDYLVAVGGTAGIPDRIAEVRKAVGDKPVRYGVMTHHHNDHVLGMPAYVTEGATVLTVKENKQVMTDAAGENAEPKFEFVDGSRVIEDGGRRVEIHDIGPTPHAEHLLIAYLPKEGIVFEADHFPLARTGPIAPAVANTEAFASALTEHGLKVKKIVGAHSPRVATMKDLQDALEREPKMAAQ